VVAVICRLLTGPRVAFRGFSGRVQVATCPVVASVVALLLVAFGLAHADPLRFALSKQPTQEGLKNHPKRWQGVLFVRTELFFGAAKSDGSDVTEDEFQQFLDIEVTPRFPEGLTLLAGRGQFRKARGVIVEERSWVLMLLYPLSAREVSSLKIERIRQAYKKAFQQESVMRADRCCEEVGF
jgi:Protein of unknown function (DUF3574)